MKNRYENLTDEELLKRLEDGEAEVTEYLLDKYKPLVKRQARTLYLIGGENDDLIQEGMIGLFKAIRGFHTDGEYSFYTFAELCITRQMYTAVQASKRKKHAPLNSYISLDEEPQIFTEQNPEVLVLDQEALENRYDQIHRNLSDMEKLVLELYLKGKTYQQIASVIGKNEKAVDNTIQRVKKKLL
ncbi:MAG: sigma-70 family RNA polymerase sigma factor [Lachnospiraceae bacterium]|nr:sigma-70 family RNA polymerase sigma factor [Lachnospiraceae bacterium]